MKGDTGMGTNELQMTEPPRMRELHGAPPAGAILCSRGCHILAPGTRFDPHTGASLEAGAETPNAAPRRLSWIAYALAPLVVALAGISVLGLLAITVGPRFLPYQALVVRSGSMSPAIPTGSVVFYHRVQANRVGVGQVIVFSEPGQPDRQVTHRVYQVKNGPTGRYFVTKGDANGAADDWRVPAVGAGWVAGFHIPVLGYVLAYLQSPLARLLLLLIPALALGGITLYEIWRERSSGRRT
jgi:signal peptidase I